MVQIRETPDGVSVIGHAQYGKPGSDIVCAGVTALVENLILSIEKLTPNSPVYEMDHGFVDIRVGSPTENTKFLFRSFFIGAENIARQFPDNVQVTRLESH